MDAISRDARFWDRVARKYAKHPIKDLAGYERTIARTRELLGKDDSVLEIGCGTGTSALLLAPAVHRILATDVSGEMIAIAREKVAAQAITNVELAVAAATEPPAAGGPFNAVLAFNVLHLVTDCPATLQHVHRLLKPGGLFISKTPCLSEMNVLIRMAVPVMQLIGKAPSVAIFRAPELEAQIERAGFEILERERHGSHRKDPRVFLVARKTDRPQSDAGPGGPDAPVAPSC